MCAVLPVKRVSHSQWAKAQQVGTVKWEPSIWLNITLTPKTKVFRNISLWKYSVIIAFSFSLSLLEAICDIWLDRNLSGLRRDLYFFSYVYHVCWNPWGLERNMGKALKLQPAFRALEFSGVEASRNVMAHVQKPDFVFRAKQTSPFKSALGVVSSVD